MESLRRNGLKDCIDIVITRNEVQRLKPAPDAIIECIKMLDLSPEDCIYIGDSVVDILAGKSAGTKTVGVLTGVSSYENLKKENPDIIIRDISELMEYVM
jgi:phosphoglycolate phosphatase-like HAD superfamily hydrolase